MKYLLTLLLTLSSCMHTPPEPRVKELVLFIKYVDIGKLGASGLVPVVVNIICGDSLYTASYIAFTFHFFSFQLTQEEEREARKQITAKIYKEYESELFCNEE